MRSASPLRGVPRVASSGPVAAFDTRSFLPDTPGTADIDHKTLVVVAVAAVASGTVASSSSFDVVVVVVAAEVPAERQKPKAAVAAVPRSSPHPHPHPLDQTGSVSSLWLFSTPSISTFSPPLSSPTPLSSSVFCFCSPLPLLLLLEVTVRLPPDCVEQHHQNQPDSLPTRRKNTANTSSSAAASVSPPLSRVSLSLNVSRRRKCPVTFPVSISSIRR